MNPAASAPTGTDHLEPVQPWREALIALPFALLFALGWRPWLPEWLVIAVVLIVFLVRRVSAINAYAPWASVYAALPAVLVSADWLERLIAFFAALVLGYLTGAALDGVARGSRWSWLAPLIAFTVWPSPWGALGGLGLALLGALENRRWRARGELGFVRPEALIALGATGLAVAAVTLGLSQTGFSLARLELGNLNRPAQVWSASSEGASASANASRTALSTPSRSDTLSASEAVFLTVQLVLIVMLLVFGTVLLRLRIEGKTRGRSSWADLMPIIAALVVAASVLAWTILGHGAEQGDLSGSGSPQSTVSNGESAKNTVGNGLESSRREVNLVWLTVGVLVVVSLAGAYLIWKLRGLDDDSSSRRAPKATDAAQDRIEATNRVRAAYRAFLVLGSRAGIPKATAETPLEFAQRISAHSLEASDAAHRLTRCYEPVRYGQLSDADGALEAEAALAELRGILGPANENTDETTVKA